MYWIWFVKETSKHVLPRWFQSDFICAQNSSAWLVLSNKTTIERFRANMLPPFFSAFKGALQFLKFSWGSFFYTQNMVINFSLLDCYTTHKTHLAHTFQHYLFKFIIFLHQLFTLLRHILCLTQTGFIGSFKNRIFGEKLSNTT